MRRPAVEEGRRWLDQAGEDLKWARRLAEEGGYHIACFLAQQVAEKALKAYLYAQGEEVVLGHSVAALVEKAASYNRDLSRQGRTWAMLDGYYIPTRYPNGLPDSIPAHVYGERIAREAVDLAGEALVAVGELIE